MSLENESESQNCRDNHKGDFPEGLCSGHCVCLGVYIKSYDQIVTIASVCASHELFDPAVAAGCEVVQHYRVSGGYGGLAVGEE